MTHFNDFLTRRGVAPLRPEGESAMPGLMERLAALEQRNAALLERVDALEKSNAGTPGNIAEPEGTAGEQNT